LGHEHIAFGDFSEGYGICDLNSGVAYDDYADSGDSGNWGAATVLGQTATSVKIARSTRDGIWTLTQTFTQMAGTSSVKVGMVLKNNTGAERTALLMRFADVDADGVFQNSLMEPGNSAFGMESSWGRYHL
jgi:hypothetical protein